MDDRTEFSRLTDPYRRELLAHCYMMLGSVDEAEDLVQETYLRAWRYFERFEGRSSLRTWLYRIATNRCLTALEGRDRRPLPSGLSGPADGHELPLEVGEKALWLQPLPDPAAVVTERESVRLALVAAMQRLSARQRAVLILREVLGWRAAETAAALDMTTTAVHSALQHARARLRLATPPQEPEPPEAERREMLTRFIAAFENADVPGLVALLREDVVLEMPPFRTWFSGRDDVVGFLAGAVLTEPGLWRLVPVAANGQMAAASYLREDDGDYHAHAVHVLALAKDGVTRVDTFLDPGLFGAFGLARTMG